MRTRVSSAILVLAAAFAGEAAAQSAARPDTAQNGVPTVTVINKAPEASEPAPPELKVTPQAVEQRSAAPVSASPPATAATAPAPASAATEAASKSETTAAPASEPAPGAPASETAQTTPPPEPTLAINIDLTRQVMTVSEDGMSVHTWPISSARYGYRTPTGTFQPTWMAKMWYSRQYDYAPMPHAIFFHQGVAIHATYATRALGRPASHGCVRLAPRNASTLFKLVNKHGKERTQIVVHGRPDHSGGEQVAYGAPVDRREAPDRIRRGAPAFRYLPPSSYAQRGPVSNYGYARTRRSYGGAPRRPPRGLYTASPYGYGF